MKKEKQIKSYTRRTKSGKTVTVRAHSAKYDAADDLVKSLLKKKGSGKEFELAVDTKGVDKLVNEMADSGRLIVPVSKEEFRAWYHEPDSIAGKAAGKKLRSVLGSKEYKKLDETASSGYSTKGHSKLYGTLDGIISSEANVSKRLDARESRSQFQNRSCCLRKLRAELERRGRPPRRRVKTKVPQRSRQRRLNDKRFNAIKKANRRKPGSDE